MGIAAGPWHIDDLATFTVNTHDVATGAGTDADSVPSYRVYEDETGTAILTGNMAKLDDANTVGFYSEQLTLSAANGFEVGKSYAIYITATVDSIAATQSLNFKVTSAPLAAASYTAPDNATIAAIDAKTTNLPADPADESLIIAATDAIVAAIAALNNLSSAQAQTAAAAALTAYDPPTKAEMDAGLAALTAPDNTKISDVWQILGLDSANPMTVTPTLRSAGTISQAITGDGVATSTVTRAP